MRGGRFEIRKSSQLSNFLLHIHLGRGCNAWRHTFSPHRLWLARNQAAALEALVVLSMLGHRQNPRS